MKSTYGLISLALALAVVSGHESSNPDVVVLTDAGFEKVTQAGSGGWFVMFYAPWCGHCKKLLPDWDKLGTELKGEINVGKLDATVNKATAERFGVRGYPTLFFFAKGKYYKYQGARTVEAMTEFVKEGYSKTTGTAVPVAPSAISRMLKTSTVGKTLVALTKNPQATGAAAAVGFICGIAVTCFLSKMCGCGSKKRKEEPKGGAKKDQ